MGTQEPTADGEELENALVVAILRCRERQLSAHIAELRSLMSAAEEAGDQQELIALSSRWDALSDERRRIHRALNERTLLWRSRGET